MNFITKHFSFIITFALFKVVLTPVFSYGASPIPDQHLHLKTALVSFNIEAHKKSLANKSYRGQEGILRVDPETGSSLGLNVLMNEEYLKAKALYEEAGGLFLEAIDAMRAREGAASSSEHENKVAELALKHNKTIALAWELMMSYRSKLTSELDDRLNEKICSSLLDKLLAEYLERCSYNLRDAVGSIYNLCQGINETGPLNLENIKCVNYVFRDVIKKASGEVLKRYDLDIQDKEDKKDSGMSWKVALGRSSTRFVSELEAAFTKHQGSECPVDPLLFLALIRQESNYDPLNVSFVGAAGLTQIMPATAKGLGMTEIYHPPYFNEAGSLMGRDRKLRHRASNLLLKIKEENSLTLAKKARGLMQEAMTCNQKWKGLYSRYRRELLKGGTDQRLDPAKSIAYGLKYFSQMMRLQGDDISLALASYNSGPHRIKEYKGIPPFEETIDFRNKVLKYYREYQARVESYRAKQTASPGETLSPESL